MHHISLASARVTISANRDAARITEGHLTVLPEISKADVKTTKTIKTMVTDEQHHPVSHIMVTFNADNSASMQSVSVETDAHGVAETTMTSTVAGGSRVTATVNKNTTIKKTTFIADKDTAQVSSVISDRTGVANGKTPVIIKAIIKDKFDNSVEGLPVDWKSDRDSSIVKFKKLQTITDEQGIARAEMTSTKAYMLW